MSVLKRTWLLLQLRETFRCAHRIVISWLFTFYWLVKFAWRCCVLFTILLASLRETEFRRLSSYWIDIWVISIEIIHWEILFLLLLNFSTHVPSFSVIIFSCYLVSSWTWFLSIFRVVLINLNPQGITTIIIGLFEISRRIVRARW